MGLFDESTGGLITHWKTVAGITALVGSGTAAKIWPHAAKQGTTPPYICFLRASGNPFYHLTGAAGARATVLHVYCYGRTPSEAESLAELVKVATQTMRGTYSETTVNRAQVEDVYDGFEFHEPGSDQKDYWVLLVARITHSETGGV